MTSAQKTYYSHVNDKNKLNIINLLSAIYPSHMFFALNDDAIDYITQFQKSYGLEVDGIVGNKTIKKMREVLNIKSSSTSTATIEKPSGQYEQPSKVLPFPSSEIKQVSYTDSEQKIKNFIEKNKYLLLISLVVGLWIKKR